LSLRKFIFIIILYISTGFFSLQGQEIEITGKVSDTLNKPLVYANLLAVPLEQNSSMAFSITNEEGIYSLKLQAYQDYEITISYMGYSKLTKIISAKEDRVENFHLKESAGNLEEILLKHTIPITVKQDTLIYNVDPFKTGVERKLRDILKNLPGVEVDREGNVTVNGKKITKVMVEDKTFFTGDSKLAVNNIPADVVNQVEVLDNYNEVAMLKGLQDSDAMAMNIKLTEDKKKFVFGDVEAGEGFKDRYVVNPKLFYYSPKTSLSFIGDINNIDEKAFTLNDYLNFEGGMNKLMNNSGAYFNLFNSEIAQFIANRDFTENESQFGALNLQQALNSSIDLSGYVIASNSDIKTASSTTNQYTTPANSFTEERTINNNINNFFTLGKAILNYKPDLEEDFEYAAFFKISNSENTGFINTQSSLQTNSIDAQSKGDVFQLKQNINYSRKFSKAHTATLEATYDVQQDKLMNSWVTNQPILQGLIPLEEEDIFTVLQDKKTTSHTFNGIVKDYWILHRFHHIYSSFGVNASFSRFFNKDRQSLDDGSINSFLGSGYNNDFDFDLINTYLGFEYKFQIGKTTFKPALFMHFFSWQNNQMGSKVSNNKTLLLPQMDAEVTFSSSEKLSFKYRLNARFPTVNQMADRFILSNFNSVFKGSSLLENERYHTANLSYYKFKMFKGFRVNAMLSLNKKESHFKNTTVLNGIEQFNTVILFDNPEHRINVTAGVSQDWKNIRYNLRGNYSYNDFFQLLNNDQNLNISKQVSGTFSFKTLFKKLPTLEAGYTKDYNNYRAADGITNFENDTFFVTLDAVFLKDFIFTADYSYNQNKNKTGSTNIFDNLNSTLFYQKEDSSWGFEITAGNILGTAFKQQNSFSNFLISDTRIFIFPRTVLFKVQYKL